MNANADTSGAQYRSQLAEMIRRSERIVVTEHSYPFDAYDTKAGKSLIPDEVVYGTRELSGREVDFFLDTVNGLDPSTQDAFAACIFEPHHTIRFYTAAESVSTMKICFKCWQVEWDGTELAPPWALYTGLAAVVKEAGFSPERDWASLAQPHLVK